jgi:TPR repeat protein
VRLLFLFLVALVSSTAHAQSGGGGVETASSTMGNAKTDLSLEQLAQACDGGDASGCSNLGNMYYKGDGVEQNKGLAEQLFSKACDGGGASGCSNLGNMYYKGDGVRQDKARAEELYSKACDGGGASGCFNLGVMYRNGDGVVKNETTAADYLRRARLLDPNIVPAR